MTTVRQAQHCECGRMLLEHVAIRQGDHLRYAASELAGWLRDAGKRTYQPRRSDRSGKRQVVKRPGPITIVCKCDRVQVMVVGAGTVVLDSA